MKRLIALGIVHCFGGGGGGYVAQPTTPSTTDPAVEEAAEKERRLARLRKGRASTILTPMTGDLEGGKKTLLGQ